MADAQSYYIDFLSEKKLFLQKSTRYTISENRALRGTQKFVIKTLNNVYLFINYISLCSNHTEHLSARLRNREIHYEDKTTIYSLSIESGQLDCILALT